jgi:hypothetical protein
MGPERSRLKATKSLGTQPMKIIFDQSAFHDHFELLKGSRLSLLTQDGKIIVFHTATFLDETVRMAESRVSPARRPEREWLNNQLSGRLSWSIALRRLKTSTFLRLCFGHQQGKEDEAAESNRCQGDETDGVTEHLYDKARTEVT